MSRKFSIGKRGLAIVLGRAGRQHAGAERARLVDQRGFARLETERGGIEDRRGGVVLVEIT